jgi:hypothetical protein
MSDVLLATNDPHCVIKAYLEGPTKDNRRVRQLDKYVALDTACLNNISVKEAVGIYIEPGKRRILNAFIFSGCPDSEIAESLGIHPDVVGAYSTHIFDSTVFNTGLDKYAFVAAADAVDKELYMYAMQFGKEFLKWKVCGKSLTIGDIRQEITELFTTAKYKAQVAAMNPITGAESKEALRWASQAAKLAEVIGKLDTAAGESKSMSMLGDEAAGRKILGVLIDLKHDTTGITPSNEISEDLA